MTRSKRFKKHPLERAPTKSPRGLTREDGFRRLSAAVLEKTIWDIKESDKPAKRWEALTWLACSDGAELMTDYLGLPTPTSWIKRGALRR